jgi:hypothetical protein
MLEGFHREERIMLRSVAELTGADGELLGLIGTPGHPYRFPEPALLQKVDPATLHAFIRKKYEPYRSDPSLFHREAGYYFRHMNLPKPARRHLFCALLRQPFRIINYRALGALLFKK